MVQADDVVIALSYSGETEELVRLLEAIRRIGARLIAMTGHPQSTLGQASDVTLSCHVAEEACPMNLAPTASTTATLALGDALAMALSRRKGFDEEHFADLHPGGRLGKKLMRVEALMHARRRRPARRPRHADAGRHPRDDQQAPRHDVRRRRPAAGLLGIVTDGDLRRHMTRGSNLLDRQAADVMTGQPGHDRGAASWPSRRSA